VPGPVPIGLDLKVFISILAWASATASDVVVTSQSCMKSSMSFLVNSWSPDLSTVSSAELGWRWYLSLKGQKFGGWLGQLLSACKQTAGSNSSQPPWSYRLAMAYLRAWIRVWLDHSDAESFGSNFNMNTPTRRDTFKNFVSLMAEVAMLF
jgi:hypothetical protein